MDDFDANPSSGSEQDPVALIERQLEREETPSTERRRDQSGRFAQDASDPYPEPDEIPEPQPGPEEDPADYDGEEDDDGAEQPEQPAEQLYTIRVDGKEQQVPLSELLNGYQRHADYTRKTMEISQTRQQVEAEAHRIAAERQHYAQQLDQVATVLQAQLPPPPDPSRVHTDPIGYMQDKEIFESRVQQLRGVMAERQRAEQQQQQHAYAVQAQNLAMARDQLLEAMPEWRQPETARKEQSQVASYLRTIGYRDEEIAQAADPRAIVMAKKAMLYDQLQASRPQVQQRLAQAPRMVRPGSSGPAPDRTKALTQQIRRSGGRDLDAVARLIELG